MQWSRPTIIALFGLRPEIGGVPEGLGQDLPASDGLLGFGRRVRWAAGFRQGQKKRCSRTGSRWSMGAGTMTWPLASSTSLLLNIQRPRRRKQVAHEAELGTGPMRGLVRPCHPVRARARATSLGVVAFVFAVCAVGGAVLGSAVLGYVMAGLF